MPSVDRQPDFQRQSTPVPSSDTWWRSLDELADTPRFRKFLEAEFPAGTDPGGVNRRSWLKMMGASLALAGVSGCRWDKQEIIPFDEYIAKDGEVGAKAAGVMRVEGKEYVMQDGDVVHFRIAGV